MTPSKQKEEPSVYWQEGQSCAFLAQDMLTPFGSRILQGPSGSPIDGHLVLPEFVKDSEGKILRLKDFYLEGERKVPSVPADGQCSLSQGGKFLHYRKGNYLRTTLVRDQMGTDGIRVPAHTNDSVDISLVGKQRPDEVALASEGGGEITFANPEERDNPPAYTCPNGRQIYEGDGGDDDGHDRQNAVNAEKWIRLEVDDSTRFRAKAVMVYELVHGCTTRVTPEIAALELYSRVKQARDTLCSGGEIEEETKTLLAGFAGSNNSSVEEARVLLLDQGVRGRLQAEIGLGGLSTLDELVECREPRRQRLQYRFNQSHLDAVRSVLSDTAVKRQVAKEFLMLSPEQVGQGKFISPPHGTNDPQIDFNADEIRFDSKTSQYTIWAYSPPIAQDVEPDPQASYKRDATNAQMRAIDATNELAANNQGRTYARSVESYGKYRTLADALGALGK